jgi:hypothetical protein
VRFVFMVVIVRMIVAASRGIDRLGASEPGWQCQLCQLYGRPARVEAISIWPRVGPDGSRSNGSSADPSRRQENIFSL